MEYLEGFLRLATALAHWTHHHSLDEGRLIITIIILECNNCRDLVGRVADFEVFDLGKEWINLLLLPKLNCLSNLMFVNVNHTQFISVIIQIHSLAMRFFVLINPFLILVFQTFHTRIFIEANNFELETITQKNFFFVRVSSSVNDVEVFFLFPKHFQKHWVVFIFFVFSSELEC